MRYLPKSLAMKNTAIEEVHDISHMEVDELIESLFTYELSLPKPKKKNMRLALKNSIPGQREHDACQ